MQAFAMAVDVVSAQSLLHSSSPLDVWEPALRRVDTWHNYEQANGFNNSGDVHILAARYSASLPAFLPLDPTRTEYVLYK